MWAGEKRIAVDGGLDPALVQGLETAGAYAAHWWGWPRPRFEARVVTVPATVAGRAASFFTGGIDSMFTLHRNLRTFPADHPLRLRRALHAFGIDNGLGVDNYSSASERRAHASLISGLSTYLDQFGVEMERLDTSMRTFVPKTEFLDHFYGAMIIGLAHASGPGVYRMPSSFSVPEAHPSASNPDLDANASGTAIRVIHDGHDFARLAKLEALKEWKADLSALHVCWATPEEGPLNCSRCHKCRRTVVELAAIGLDGVVAQAFPDASVAEVLDTWRPSGENDMVFIRAALAALHRNGRPTAALERHLADYRSTRRRVEERDWRRIPKRLLRRVGLR